jgi:hypothetical protein
MVVVRRWGSTHLCQAFLINLAHAKGFSPLDANCWYTINKSDILKHGGRGLLRKYGGSHIKAIIVLFPELQLSPNKFSTSLKEEKVLWKIVRSIFGGKYKIVLHARKGSGIASPITGYFLELDVWLPELKLAFEFQDKHHYVSTWYSNYSLEQYPPIKL